MDIKPLIDAYHRKLAETNLQFKRYLYSKINWNARIICIKGARGVGKTTMLLQHILDNYENPDDVLYVALNNLWFANHSLIELVDWAFRNNIMRLYLDEVHHYKLWAETINNIYDNYPGMKIVYTGSSLLLMDHRKADLSRRQTSYTLYGMSFREFLEYNDLYRSSSFSLEQILNSHVKIASEIIKKIKIEPLFEKYLTHGYYPFYNEEPADFVMRLRETVSVVIEYDMPAVETMSFETLQKVKKLLMIISENVPFEPNLSELWGHLSTSHELGLKMIYALYRSCILNLLSSKQKKSKHLQKPNKIFLGDTNLMHALCPTVNKGNEREAFFLSQLRVNHYVDYPDKGDFMIDDTFLFEIGGKNKKFSQIADIPNSYLAVDNTDVGYKNRIPLWLFGFLY